MNNNLTLRIMHGVIVLFGVSLIGTVIYVALRIQQMTAAQVDFTREHQQLTTAISVNAQKLDTLVIRLDNVESLLFGDVLSAVRNQEKPTPAGRPPVESWQVNRDRELRARIVQLEYARRQLEIHLEELKNSK